MVTLGRRARSLSPCIRRKDSKMEEKRKVELKVQDEWKEIKFEELKAGDTFKLFEPDSEPVITDDNRSEFLCLSDAYLGPHGPDKTVVWTVNTDEPGS